MMSSDEEDSDCPLCMEELDIADRNFRPCPCGYQICRFCWHHIKTNLNGRCPACRRLYSDQIVEFVPVSAEEIMRLKKEKKEKDRQTREMKDPSRRQLSNVRVVQKNLVYVLGLSSKYANAENEFFKKYGRIDKVVISRRTAPSGTSSSVGIYITYIRKEDASRAIEGINGLEIDGKTIRASYGTTKYCTYYLRHMACPNPNCMYLHEPGDDVDSYNKDTIPIGKHAASTSTTTSGFPNKRAATTTKVAPTVSSAASTTTEPKPATTPRTWAPIPKVVPISPIVVEKEKTDTEPVPSPLLKENVKPSTSVKNAKPTPGASSSISTSKSSTTAKTLKKTPSVIDKSNKVKKAPTVEEDEKPALPATASWATNQAAVNMENNIMTPANFGPSLSDALNAPQKPKHSPSLKVKKEKKTKSKMVRLEEFEEAEREAKMAANKPKTDTAQSATTVDGELANAQRPTEDVQPSPKKPVVDDSLLETEDIHVDSHEMSKVEESKPVDKVSEEKNDAMEENADTDVSGIQREDIDENKSVKDTALSHDNDDKASKEDVVLNDNLNDVEIEEDKASESLYKGLEASNDGHLKLDNNQVSENGEILAHENAAVNSETVADMEQHSFGKGVNDELAAMNETIVKAFDEAAAAEATSEKVLNDEIIEHTEQDGEYSNTYDNQQEHLVQSITSPLAAMDRLSALVQQELMDDLFEQPPFEPSQPQEVEEQQNQPLMQQQPPSYPNRFDMNMNMQEPFENRHSPAPPPGLGGPPPPPPGWMNRGFDPFNGQDPSVIAARRLQHSQRMLEASGLFGGHPPVVPRFGFSPDYNRGSNGFLPQQPPPPMGMFHPPPPPPPHPMMRRGPPPELMNMQSPFGPPMHMHPQIPPPHIQQRNLQQLQQHQNQDNQLNETGQTQDVLPLSQPLLQQQQMMGDLRNDFNSMKISSNNEYHQQSRDDLRALLPNVNISFNNLEEKRRAEEFYQQQLLMQRQQQQQHMLQQQQMHQHLQQQQALQQQRKNEQEQMLYRGEINPNHTLRPPEFSSLPSSPLQALEDKVLTKSPLNQNWQQEQLSPQQENDRVNPDVREAQNFFGEFLRKAASNQQEGSSQKDDAPVPQNHSLPFQDPAIMSVHVDSNDNVPTNDVINSQNTILRILGGQTAPPSGMMTLEQQQQMHQQRQLDARYMAEQQHRAMHQNDMGPKPFHNMFMRPPPPLNFPQQQPPAQQQQQSPQQQFHQQGSNSFMSNFREPHMGMMGRMPPPPPGMMRPPMPPLGDMNFRNMVNGQPFPRTPPPPGMFSNEENRQ